MNTDTRPQGKRLGRFDRVILAVMALLAILAGVLIWRGYLAVSPPAETEATYRILYLAPDESGRIQLFVFSRRSAESIRLTGEAGDVLEYAVSPDGGLVAYVILRQDNGNDLWVIKTDGRARRKLLEDCAQPVWSPDGKRLACTHRQGEEPPELWWTDIAGGQPAPLFTDKQAGASAASWSYEGDWLAYVVPDGKRVTNLRDQRDILFPTHLQEPAVWNETEDILLMTFDQFLGLFPVVWIMSADPVNGQVTNLSGEELVDDGSPVWSHDGQWIAFSRKGANVTMGKQIWLMRRDGSDARPLTDETMVNHAIPAWSHDDRLLVYQRYTLAQPDAPPSIWLLDVETGNQEELVASGRLPAWLP